MMKIIYTVLSTITQPPPSTPQSEIPPVSSPTQQDLHPHLIFDDTLLHPAPTYLATTPLTILTQDNMRSKYVLAVDAISSMPSPTTTPISNTRYIYTACEPITGQVNSD